MNLKHLLRRMILLLLACAAVACTTLDLNAAGAGKDGGHLIAALGASPETRYARYVLKFRKVDKTAAGELRYVQENTQDASHRDFDDQTENGLVHVLDLPPGEYEIYNFDIIQDNQAGRKLFKSAADFSIPFRIVSGSATYLGDFTAIGIVAKDVFGATISAGAYFSLADRQARDVPIAHRKVPSIGEVRSALPKSGAELETAFIQLKKAP